MPDATRQSSAPHAVGFAYSDTASLHALTPRERHDHDRLPHQTRRREWLAGRVAAKRAIGGFFGASLPLSHVELEPREAAAPRCLVRDGCGRWTLAPVVISIAHTEGVAIAVAASPSTRIGVDVDREGDIDADQKRYFLAPSERVYAQRFGATLIWVLKEALWKALGLSQALAFSSVQLAFFHGTDTLAGAWVDESWVSARAHRIRLANRPELVAAVVTVDEETR